MGVLIVHLCLWKLVQQHDDTNSLAPLIFPKKIARITATYALDGGCTNATATATATATALCINAD